MKFIACVTVLVVGGAAGAQIHEGDIAIGLVGNQIAVSDNSRDDLGNLLFEGGVFGIELDGNARSTDPGFDSNFDVYNASARIGYQHVTALRKWDGTDFETIPAERLRMSIGPVPGVSTPLSDGEVLDGPTITVGSDGEFHHHYTFRIELDGSPATAPDNAGVYLATLRLYDANAIHETSEDFWLLLDNNADPQELVDAEAYARSTLLGDAPGCLADVSGDGALSGADFNAWLTAFSTGDPAADQNRDGNLTGADFNAFLTNFSAGCNF